MTGAAVEAEYAGASPAAIRHHYDLGNDFYRLWLDETLTYSCALWDEGDTLESAQCRKLDYLIDGARAAGAARVLDVGCGWGSLLRRLVETHGVGHAVGLTLSDAQAEVAAEVAGPRAEVRVENWIDHEVGEPYDAIISIGAFEHFANYGMQREDRLDAYRRFFSFCASALPRGGRLALQTNVKGNNVRLDRQTASELRFVLERIFPESELPWSSEVLIASERTFEPVSVRNDPDHYARTCAEWRDRLRARRDEAVALVGEEATADYERYLSVTVGHFERRHIGLSRYVFERV
jgi:cyclopropane-fatty-acyl-phospholipid synthase